MCVASSNTQGVTTTTARLSHLTVTHTRGDKWVHRGKETCLTWIFVLRFVRRMQYSGVVQAPADMRFFDLSQIGFCGFGSNSRKTPAADRIDRSIRIASVRKEGTERYGHSWPRFMLLSVRKLLHRHYAHFS